MKLESSVESEFKQLAEPMMNWLSKNCNPHMKVEITSNSAEILGNSKWQSNMSPDVLSQRVNVMEPLVFTKKLS